MENSSAKNIKAGAVLTYVTQFLSIAISFVYVPIMMGRLGQSEYGLYSIVQSLISYLQMSELGIGTTATRYNSKYIADHDAEGQKTINGMFFKMYLGIAAVCVIVATVLYCFLDDIYASYSDQSIALIKVLFVIAVINLVITFVFQVFNAIVIAYEEYIFLKIITLIQTLLGPAGMLMVLYLGFGSIGMLCVTTLISLLFGLIQMYFCIRKYGISFHFRGHDKQLFRKIMSFTVFVFVNSMATQLMMNSDKVIISIIMTEYAVAIYAIVTQFHVYAYNFSNVLSGFYLPRFTKVISREKGISNEVIQDMILTGRIQVLVAGLIFGGFLAIGEPFIIRWVGAEYAQAYWLTVIVLLTELIGSAQSMFNSLMQAMNLHKTRAILSLALSVIKIVFTIVLTYMYGLMGCAIAFFAGWSLKQIVFNVYYHKRVGIDILSFWKELLKLLVPLCAAIVVLYFTAIAVQRIIPADTYLVLMTYALIYTVLYCGIIWMSVLNADEKAVLRGIWNKIRK